MNFTTAITRRPCRQMVHGITTANLGIPDYDLALKQHDAYLEALHYCGLNVTVLEADENFPDSTFVEDTALCTPQCAIISNPGATSRKGEEALMIPVLEKCYDAVERITGRATIEPGDIMMVGHHYYIGLSDRTNREGAETLIKILGRYGMTGSILSVGDMLHLKTGLSYLEHNNLVVHASFANHPAFESFNIVTVDNQEAYAANCVWINDKVLLPAGFPNIRTKIQQLGYEVLPLEMSEFQKLDGGLSCLSLRF